MFSYSFLLLMSFFKSRDQVLSMTPKTQEQVDILKNVSTQYQVEISLFPPIVSDSSDSSSCESCVFLPLTRQPYGSQPHPSTSKRRPRSTSLSLQTARRPSWICYRNTPSLTSTSESRPPELALKASRILSRLLFCFFQGFAARRQRADRNADEERLERPAEQHHLLREIPQSGGRMLTAPHCFIIVTKEVFSLLPALLSVHVDGFGGSFSLKMAALSKK